MGPKGKLKTVLQPFVEGPNGLQPAMMCPNWVVPAGLPTKRQCEGNLAGYKSTDSEDDRKMKQYDKKKLWKEGDFYKMKKIKSRLNLDGLIKDSKILWPYTLDKEGNYVQMQQNDERFPKAKWTRLNKKRVVANRADSSSDSDVGGKAGGMKLKLSVGGKKKKHKKKTTVCCVIF